MKSYSIIMTGNTEYSVIDEKDKVLFSGLSREQANAKARHLLANGREPVDILCGYTEWIESKYGEILLWYKKG